MKATKEGRETPQSEQCYSNTLSHWELMKQQKYLHCTGKDHKKQQKEERLI